MKRFVEPARPEMVLAIGALFLGVLALDAFTPLGVSIWVLYLVPIGLTLQTWHPVLPVAAAAFATLLTCLGYFLSSPAIVHPWLPVVNRVIGAVAFWALGLLGRSLLRSRLEVRRHMWLSAGQARLTVAVQGDRPVAALASSALEELVATLGAAAGAVFVTDGAGGFVRAAGHALPEDEGPARYRPGEGLGGQAAASRRVLTGAGGAEWLRLTSALGVARAVGVVAAPALVDDEAVAVVELGFDRGVSPLDAELLERALPRLALTLRSARERARVAELLAETQAQAAELEAQAEELRVTNEELQQQGEELRTSQAQLELQQSELQATNTALERQAAELQQRSSELTQARGALEERAAALERASRYKSEFLANMSHELRTPLNSTLILSRLLAEGRGGALTPEGVKYAQTIVSASEDLLALINDILDLAKVEAGRVDLQVSDVDLAGLVEDLGRAFDPVAAQRALAFERRLEPGVPARLRTDPLRLVQVLRNLLSNAFKFTERGGVTLTARPAPEGGVAFEVRDTGVGIAPADQGAIFEAFRQVDASSARRHGGAGLGLSISRELTGLLCGSLEVESAPGRGSTFTLTLPREPPARGPRPAVSAAAPRIPAAPARPAPRAAAAEQATTAPSAPPIAPGTSTAPAAERLIVIVEDDPGFAEVLAGVARERGFEAATAGSAEEGLEIVRSRRPAAVLLDVGLPDRSGVSLLDELKRDPATRHLPVHVISAHEFTRDALERGAIGYAVKPVLRDRLLEAFAAIEDRLTRRPRRVLVVEDDAGQRESLVALLGSRGVEIDTAGSVAEALAALRESAYDCVVLDLGLPGGGGEELLERMGREEVPSHPPVIVYTGRALDPAEEARLRQRSRSIVVKGARSPERLLDEVTLFLHQVESELPAERRRMLAEARSRDAVLDGRTLLLVEDDVRNVFALTAALEPRGARVEIARNGEEALQALARLPRVELVLMDIMMPVMDGYEAIRRIRADPRWERLPILALTARAMRDDQDRCLRVGANEVLPKPIDVDKLLALLRVWLPRRP